MPGRPIALACLLAAAAFVPAPLALAQDPAATTTVVPPINPSGDQLAGTTPAPAAGGVAPEGIAPDDAELPPASSTTAPAATTPGGPDATPTPPPYLAPGQDAEVQPVSSVSSLTDPDVPLEPLRIAALVAALLAALALGAATLLRTLGLRTATGPAVVPSRSDAGPVSRARERVNAVADDVRDFLRHSR